VVDGNSSTAPPKDDNSRKKHWAMEYFSKNEDGRIVCCFCGTPRRNELRQAILHLIRSTNGCKGANQLDVLWRLKFTFSHSRRMKMAQKLAQNLKLTTNSCNAMTAPRPVTVDAVFFRLLSSFGGAVLLFPSTTGSPSGSIDHVLYIYILQNTADLPPDATQSQFHTKGTEL